jgi:hypothetical protein
MDERQVTELARRICAAMLSYQIGVGMDYCYRRYIQDKTELGGLWYDIAEQARPDEPRDAQPVAARCGPGGPGAGGLVGTVAAPVLRREGPCRHADCRSACRVLEWGPFQPAAVCFVAVDCG